MGVRVQYEGISVPVEVARKLRDVSKVTRVPKTQILRQLIEAHLDDWHRAFFEKHPGGSR